MAEPRQGVVTAADGHEVALGITRFADARLIAAAPELLAMLRTVVDFADEWNQMLCEAGGVAHAQPPLIGSARAIIARIEGNNG